MSTNSDSTAEKKPYTPPQVISEEVFETLALSCDKMAGDLGPCDAGTTTS